MTTREDRRDADQAAADSWRSAIFSGASGATISTKSPSRKLGRATTRTMRFCAAEQGLERRAPGQRRSALAQVDQIGRARHARRRQQQPAHAAALHRDRDHAGAVQQLARAACRRPPGWARLDRQRRELARAHAVVQPAVLELGQRGGQDQQAEQGHEQHRSGSAAATTGRLARTTGGRRAPRRLLDARSGPALGSAGGAASAMRSSVTARGAAPATLTRPARRVASRGARSARATSSASADQRQHDPRLQQAVQIAAAGGLASAAFTVEPSSHR